MSTDLYQRMQAEERTLVEWILRHAADPEALRPRAELLVRQFIEALREETHRLGDFVRDLADGELAGERPWQELHQALDLLEIRAWRVCALRSGPRMERMADIEAVTAVVNDARRQLALVLVEARPER